MRAAHTPRLLTAVVLLLIALVVPAAAGAQTVLVPTGAVWKYRDNGSNQGTAWRARTFNDSAWASGPAQLGYGDGGEATVVGYGPSASSKYITTYFRHAFTVADPSLFSGLTLRLLRDDGAVVYLNGTQVFRSNMPSGTIGYRTLASTAIGGANENAFVSTTLGAGGLVAGTNVLAVEVHQSSGSSSDLSFDLELIGTTSSLALTRGPYLQMGSSTETTVRWRTNLPSASRVRYGGDPANLTNVVDLAPGTTEHEVRLSGLTPDTRYYYAIGTPTTTLAGGDSTHFFVTAPVPGSAKPTRIWVLGDSGTADANARAVRDAYLAYTGARHTDLWLMLGDNAYQDGTDAEFQAAVFDMYPSVLRKSVLWPTYGNHDGQAADSATQTGPYYDVFSLPAQGQAGGVPSGTEAYYSFDYGNIHFISLESFETDRSSTGPMMTWLRNDLAATTRPWIIAFWHHPPYSKGAHNSDTAIELVQMRQNALPILEAAGVDLVLTGHSRSYERSFLIDGHYGVSSTLTPAMILDGGDGRENGAGAYQKPETVKAPREGAVYAVAGSSGSTSGGPLNHPAMFISLNTLGSMVLDVDGGRLDAVFLDSTGLVRDYFTIVKSTAQSPDTTPPVVAITAPTSGATYTTNVTPLTLGGIAADSVGVTAVSWVNSAGGSGPASGTTTWSAPGIVLPPGLNVVTVTAFDAASNPGTATLTVTYDPTPPTIGIAAPTAESTFTTTTSPLTLGGAAGDNLGVTQVTWANSRGGSGTAAGTTAWSTSGIALQPGANVLTVTARDAAGNTATATLIVSYSVPDTTPPTVAITTPTSGATYVTNVTPLTLGGTAADNVGVTTVSWSDGTGGGPASGTTTWSAPGIALQPGPNVLTVTARDAANNPGTATLTVTYDATAPTVGLTAPASGATVSGTSTLTAIAADNVTVAGVQFLLDGAPLGPEQSSGFSLSWNTTATPNGPHILTARARDAAGNTTLSAGVTVTVNNLQPTGLVAAYGFNETSGSGVTDVSGHQNTGTLGAGVTRTAQGRFGSALVFAGASFVTVPHSASLSLTSAMTLQAWVYPTAVATNWSTVLLKEQPGELVYALYAGSDGNIPHVYFNVGTSSSTGRGFAGPSVLPLNTWSHLAATYDGTTLRLYVNGAQVASQVLTGPIATSTSALRIGGNGVWGEYFQGRLDEIRIYNRALTQGEIQADMATPIAP